MLYSWRKARNQFYEALKADTKDDRDEKFSPFYNQLGRVLVTSQKALVWVLISL